MNKSPKFGLDMGGLKQVGGLLAGPIQLDQGEPLDYISVHYVLLDDLRHVIGRHLAIPNAVRVNEHSRADGAKADRAAIRQNDLPVWVPSLRLLPLTQAF